MNKLKFNSQICTTKEQSKRLLELGLKPETADMCHFCSTNDDIENPYTRMVVEDYIDITLEDNNKDVIPAWSLHRLIELGGFNVECKGLFWRVTGTYFSESCDKIYDTIIDSIEALITENLLNKEYLKQ